VLAVLATLATMKAAMDRGDVDEAARQGELAGPAVVEQALGSTDRATVLAGIAAAPLVVDHLELLPALARIATSGDRRIAIPAAAAARTIARDFRELPDDLTTDDVVAWHDAFTAIAMAPARFVDVRTRALEVAALLAHAVDATAIGFDLGAALADRDPAFRITAAELVPIPAPKEALPPLLSAVAKDPEPAVALAAAQAMCNAPPALDDATKARIRTLVADPASPLAAARDAARCLTGDAASADALATLAKRTK